MTDTQKLAQEIDQYLKGYGHLPIYDGHISPIGGHEEALLLLKKARDALPVWLPAEDVKYKKGEVYVTRFKPVIREYRPELSLQTAYEVSVGKKAIMGRREPDMVLCLPQPPEPD